MTDLTRVFSLALAGIALATSAAAQVMIPLTPDRWTASDSLRFETFLGKSSLYIDRGVALARDVSMRTGTIEFDMAATARTNFLGAVFHAQALDNFEVVFFRLGSTGTSEAVQYGPALNGFGAAWQVYHGDGANAVATLERQRWHHVRMVIGETTLSMHLDGAEKPTLVVPRLAGVSGGGVGVWAGAFGRGAYFANIQYTPAPATSVAQTAAPALPRGTVVEWQLSEALDAPSLTPGTLPDLARLTWAPVRAESPGIVLVNRYRRAPVASVPVDPTTRLTLDDSIMGGRVAGTKTVFARTTIESDRDGYRRMMFGYSDGVVVYANGAPLFFGMNAQGLRDGLGVMWTVGDAVYLPLKKGRNEIVFAVTEYSGGWAYWARLDPSGHSEKVILRTPSEARGAKDLFLAI